VYSLHDNMEVSYRKVKHRSCAIVITICSTQAPLHYEMALQGQDTSMSATCQIAHNGLAPAIAGGPSKALNPKSLEKQIFTIPQ